MGRASFGARRNEAALPRLTSVRQNLWKSMQGSMVMQRPNINIHRQFVALSSALASVTSLTVVQPDINVLRTLLPANWDVGGRIGDISWAENPLGSRAHCRLQEDYRD